MPLWVPLTVCACSRPQPYCPSLRQASSGKLPPASGITRALTSPELSGGAMLPCPHSTLCWNPHSLPFPLVMKYSCQQSRSSLGRLPASSLRLAQAFKERELFLPSKHFLSLRSIMHFTRGFLFSKPALPPSSSLSSSQPFSFLSFTC